jgi:hypothetical protein
MSKIAIVAAISERNNERVIGHFFITYSHGVKSYLAGSECTLSDINELLLEGHSVVISPEEISVPEQT